MTVHKYSDLKEHMGHKIVCVGYGRVEDPYNVSLECETCSEVLKSYDKPDKPEK